MAPVKSQILTCRHAGTIKAKHHVRYMTSGHKDLLEFYPPDYIHDDKLWRGVQCSDAEDLIAEACSKHARTSQSIPAFF